MSNKILFAIGGALVVAAVVLFAVQKGFGDKGKSMENTNQPAMDAGQVAGQKAPQGDLRLVEIKVKDFGVIKVELYEKDAPKTVANFLGLTEKGYYNGVTFHRVAKGFVIQGGDPTGTGAGGDSIYGGEFADELNPLTESYKAGYKKGVLAMANRGPNTNTSQFFIMLQDNMTLPKNYTIFGKVVSGLDVVEKIGQVDINPGPFGPGDGQPKEPVVMESVKEVK